MEIKLAPNAGFCFGVRAAINKGEKLIEEGKGPIATLGPLIHNPQEVARLESLGIRSYDDLKDIQEENVLIRTHGVAPSVYQDIETAGHTYFDCTCPKVKKVQQIAREHAEAGYQVLILGDRNHPEVHQAVRSILQKMNVDVVEAKRNKENSVYCGTLHYETENHALLEKLKAYPDAKISELPLELQKELMEDNFEGVDLDMQIIVDCNRCLKGVELAGRKGIHLLNLVMKNYL